MHRFTVQKQFFWWLQNFIRKNSCTVKLIGKLCKTQKIQMDFGVVGMIRSQHYEALPQPSKIYRKRFNKITPHYICIKASFIFKCYVIVWYLAQLSLWLRGWFALSLAGMTFEPSRNAPRSTLHGLNLFRPSIMASSSIGKASVAALHPTEVFLWM